MKIVAIIPARYKSSRFPGKPLANICGKPMIWWVYHQVIQAQKVDYVIVATDDKRISDVCDLYSMKVIMTSDNLPEHISRIHEVSEKIAADYYMCINGDEPLVSPECIDTVVPDKFDENIYYKGAFRTLCDPAETVDFTNIKVVLADDGRCLYMSRTPVPYPRGTLLFKYKKYMGIECFTKKGLDFFVNTKQGLVEKIEDIDHIRFLENGIPIYFTEVNSESISVDTPKDLEKVRDILSEKIASGEIVL